MLNPLGYTTLSHSDVELVTSQVGRDLISLVTSREGISELLHNDDVIDLVIPRGSNALVRVLNLS